MLKTNRTQGYIRSFDHHRLFYSCEGPPNAPVLLFVYGLMCSSINWKYQIDYFKKKYRVLYLDFRGHSRSDTPEDFSQVTLENLTKDLATLHDELDLGPVPVLGYSFGVNVALEFYRMFPKKASSLVLLSGTPKDPFETMFHHNFLQVGFEQLSRFYYAAPELFSKIWKLQSLNPLCKEFITRVGFDRKLAKKADIAGYVETALATDPGVFMELLASFVDYDACCWLSEIKIPVLIMGGERDMIIPPINQKILHKLISGSELVIWPGGSHSVQMEQKEKVNERIEDFVGAL